MLSQVTGDILGHQTAQAVRAQFGWIKERATSAQRLTGEFLTEELKALPSKLELQDFYGQVDELRLAVDRAAARVELFLSEKINP